MRPSQVQRPLLAGVLQSMWGVTPPTVAWGDADQAPVTSHLWALGLNPFGLLGAGSRLSFVQRDAAQRNLVHAYLAATTASVRPLRVGVGVRVRVGVACLPRRRHCLGTPWGWGWGRVGWFTHRGVHFF